jgi:hypothetical protein
LLDAPQWRKIGQNQNAKKLSGKSKIRITCLGKKHHIEHSDEPLIEQHCHLAHVFALACSSNFNGAMKTWRKTKHINTTCLAMRISTMQSKSVENNNVHAPRHSNLNFDRMSYMHACSAVFALNVSINRIIYARKKKDYPFLPG